jgi:HSP20 family protein
MIERYDPLREMVSLRQLMDRLFENSFVMPGDSQAASPGNLGLNVYEEGDKLFVEAQLPGIKPEDVEISVEDGILTIRGQIRAEEERKERNYLVREQRSGAFVRSLRLPSSVDPDHAEASFENGMLRLAFPKTERARARRIALTSGTGQEGPRSQSAEPHASQRGEERGERQKAA